MVIGQLTPELYWEWRAAIAEMNLAKKEEMCQHQHYNLLIKDYEINKLAALVFKQGLDIYKSKTSSSKQEYEDTRKKIETFLGQTLDGCSINESLEVIKLEESKKD